MDPLSLLLLAARFLPLALRLFGLLGAAGNWEKKLMVKHVERKVDIAQKAVDKLPDGAAADELRRKWARKKPTG